MINMMKADFYRIFKGMGIYIGIAIMIGMIAMSIYAVSPGSVGVHVGSGTEMNNELSDMSYEEINHMSISEFRKYMLKTKNYKLDKDILSANVNLYYIFIFVGAVLITADFSGGCIKNTLSSAISRKKYYISKLVIVNLCCVALLFLNTYIMYFANLIFNNRNLASGIGTVTQITLLQLPPMLAFGCILTGLAFLLKKTAAFNTVTIPLIIVIQALWRFLSFILKLPEKISEFEFQNMIMKLANAPGTTYMTQSYLFCAVIIIAAILLGWVFFKKAEIR